MEANRTGYSRRPQYYMTKIKKYIGRYFVLSYDKGGPMKLVLKQYNMDKQIYAWSNGFQVKVCKFIILSKISYKNHTMFFFFFKIFFVLFKL